MSRPRARVRGRRSVAPAGPLGRGGQAAADAVLASIAVGLVALFAIVRLGGALTKRYECSAGTVGTARIALGGSPSATGCDEAGIAAAEPPAEPTTPPSERFDDPMVGDVPLDHCLTFGRDCGKPAADAFCRGRGFSEAKEFRTKTVSSTRTAGGELCDRSFAPERAPFCGSITSVECG